MTKRTESSRDKAEDRKHRASNIDSDFHACSYAISDRGLWTELLIFFMIGTAFGALAFAVFSSLH